MEKKILVGVILRAHGIKGAVVVKSFTDPKSNIGKLALVNEDDYNISLKLINVKSLANENLICTIDNINNRTDAEKLRNTKLYCLRSSMPPTALDEFYISDLINLKVVNMELKQIGVVKNIFNFGAGDIIEIENINNALNQKDKLQLFPFTHSYFPTITSEYIILNYTSNIIAKD